MYREYAREHSTLTPIIHTFRKYRSVQNEIKYNDVEIPVENRLGKEGTGFIIAKRLAAIMASQQHPQQLQMKFTPFLTFSPN